MSEPIYIPAPRVTLADKAGLASREWFRYFQMQFERLGGISGVIPVPSGGTGLDTVTQGELLYGSALDTYSLLAKSGTVSYLDNSGTTNNPAWKAKAALTRVDDTNVTLTLSAGAPTALLVATSITAGWAGQLSMARGGSGAALVASNGGVVYTDANSMEVLAGTATARQMLQSGASAAPAWSTTTWPATLTVNRVLYGTSANVVGSSAGLTFDGSTLAIDGASAAFLTTTAALSTGSAVAAMTYTNSGVLRTQLNGIGTQQWWLHNTAAEAGSIAYTTPGGKPGIMIIGTTVANRVVMVLDGSTMTLGASSTTTAPQQVSLTAAGNVGVGTLVPSTLVTVVGVDNKDTGPIMSLTGTAANQVESGRLRFTEVLTSTSYQGAFIHYNGSANTLNIGVHAAADVLTASDTNALIIPRASGFVGIQISPTAALTLPAGTATANTAPLKFTTGTLLGTAEAGAVEFLTDKYYGTITTGAARKELTLNDAALTTGRVVWTTTNGRVKDSANLLWDDTSLTVLPAGPHAFGSVTSANNQITVGGTFAGNTSAFGVVAQQTLTPAANGGSTGIIAQPVITPASSGTHSRLAGIWAVPSFTGGLGSSVTNAASITAAGFTAPANCTNASTIRVESAPTAATNNYGLWVAAGKAKFDGAMEFGTHSALGAETVTGFITITDAGGVTRKLAVVS